MSTPEIPSDGRPPFDGGGSFFNNLRAQFGRTPGLIACLIALGVAAIQYNDAGAWPTVVLVTVGIIAAIYCAKNRIH
jgi:hypothetical protein